MMDVVSNKKIIDTASVEDNGEVEVVGASRKPCACSTTKLLILEKFEYLCKTTIEVSMLSGTLNYHTPRTANVFKKY